VAAAAGVFLVVLPVEMAIAGALIVAGLVLRTTSLGTTVGLASVPAVAAARGQPGPFIALALALFALIVGRRLEGVGVVVRAGVSPAQALWYRVVFDSSGPPRHGTSGAPGAGSCRSTAAPRSPTPIASGLSPIGRPTRSGRATRWWSWSRPWGTPPMN